MMGRTHFASGVVAALGVAAATDLPAASVPVMVAACALSAYMPDVDHHSSTAGRLLPPVRWAVRSLSVRTVGIAHRGLSHSLLAAITWGVLAGVLSAFWLVPLAAFWVGVFAAAGYLSGVLGDVPTIQSLQYVLWPSRVQVRWPVWLRFRTNGPFERFVFLVLVAVGILLVPAVAA